MPIYFGSQLISELRVGTQLYDGYVGSQMVHGVIADPVFANNDWETIIAVCQSGNVPETWAVGDQKAMTIGGTSYLIDIIGKNHDTYTGGGTAPLTFQMHDCYGTTNQMNSSNTNTGGYNSSAMHTSHLPAIKALMPSEVQAAIKPVDKLTSAGNTSTTIVTVSCNLFLLSEIEVFGRTTYSASGEGSQYAYYQAGYSKLKKVSGTARYWYERSPQVNGDYAFGAVDSSGSPAFARSSYSHGVAFAFCF